MMTTLEKRATLSIGLIFSFRMLGLFIILPVFAMAAAQDLTGATPELIGFAIGIYGLTQACFQIPLATLSDRIGRRPVIVAGLILFAIGSLIAGFATSIDGVIIGRALQGAGAIGSTLMAMLADLTSEKHRTKAMATVGMTIGLSFSASMLLGPLLLHSIGLDGIFYLTALLALSGILILLFVTPPSHAHFHRDTSPVLSQLGAMLKKPELLRLNFGIFSLHAMLTSAFLVIPNFFPKENLWMYFLAVILSFIVAIPFIIIGEKKNKIKEVFLGTIVVLIMTQLGFLHVHLISLYLLLFLAAFTLCEALLPSMISKIAPPASKGSAMGIYSTFQFLGIFVGGALGGVLLKYNSHAPFVFCSGLGLLWLLIAAFMKRPLQKPIDR